MSGTVVAAALLLFAGGFMHGADHRVEIEEVKKGVRQEALGEWWVKSSGDQRAALQQALDSGARKIVIGRKNSPWLVGGQLNIRSNTELVFEDGAEIRAMPGAFKDIHETLLMITGSENIHIHGRGICTMDKKAFQNPALYQHSEWRHALAVFTSRNLRIEDVVFQKSGGDGIYLNRVENVRISGVKCLDNHRQGISVISARNLLIENSDLCNTVGTSPTAGIDFEPNNWQEELVNCVVDNCRLNDNNRFGILMACHMLDKRSVPISITIRNCEMKNNLESGISLMVRPTRGGTVNIENCRVSSRVRHQYSYFSRGQEIGGVKVTMSDCVFDNSNAKVNGALYMIGVPENKTLGGMHVKNIRVIDSRPAGRAFQFDDLGICGLQDLAGNVVLSSGKVCDLKDEVTAAAKWSRVRNARLEEARLEPAAEKIGGGWKRELLRCRSHADFLQYARKGEEITIKVIPSKIGRTALPMTFNLIAPSGKEAGQWTFTDKSASTDIQFKAEETGVYHLKYKSLNGVYFSSDRPGSGLNASSEIWLNHTPGRMYFHVPENVRQVAVLMRGATGEWVDADLLDGQGNVVSSGKKSSVKILLRAMRTNLKGEVWSLRINRAKDDFFLTIMGDSIPVFSETPDSVLKYR